MARPSRTLERRDNCPCDRPVSMRSNPGPADPPEEVAWRRGLYTGVGAASLTIALLQLARWYRDRRAAVTV